MPTKEFFEKMCNIGFASRNDTIVGGNSPTCQNRNTLQQQNTVFLSSKIKYTITIPQDAIPKFKTFPNFEYNPNNKIIQVFQRFLEFSQIALTNPNVDFTQALIYLNEFIDLSKRLNKKYDSINEYIERLSYYEVINSNNGDLFIVTDKSEIEIVRRKTQNNEKINLKDYSSTRKILSLESVEGDPRETPFEGIPNESFSLKRQIELIKHGIENINGYNCIVAESDRGDLDYKKYFYSGELINLNGIYMNNHESLNYMWGAALNEIKNTGKVNVTLEEALGGAQLYHMWDARPNGGRSTGIKNQENHNKAIRLGWEFNENRWKENKNNRIKIDK